MVRLGGSGPHPVWLFDLDNTLHDASHASFRHMHESMNAYIVRHLDKTTAEAEALRRRYFHHYGATLLGLLRHHGVDAAHFLHETHRMPGLEARVRGHRHDLACLRALPGRKVLLTNAPLAYTRRVLGVLGLARFFERIVSIEDMAMFGHLRPKPDARMLRRLLARLRVSASCCVLVEDSLENLKSARRLRVRTVWMQRWTRGATWGAAAQARVHVQPRYVDQRVLGLRALRRRLTTEP
jgi:putative hydrolase of the HAD superfamily